MPDKQKPYQPDAIQKARPGKWVRFNDIYGSGMRRQSYDGKFVYETHYDKGAGQPKDINLWGTHVTTLPKPTKPGSLEDFQDQVATKIVSTTSKVRGGIEAGKSTAGAGYTVATSARGAGGIAAGIAGARSTLGVGGLVGSIARVAGPVTIAVAPALVITGILEALGLEPGRSPVAQQIYSEQQGGGFFGAQPGRPDYKGAKFQGGKLVGQSVDDSNRRDRSWYPDWVPKSLQDPKKSEKLKEYLGKVGQLDRLLKEKVGRGVPTGSLYNNYTDITRYSDPAHGNKPTTYHFLGEVGEKQLIKVRGGYGLTYYGRVTHGKKPGIVEDIGGKRYLANKTAIYATRALAASGGNLDPKSAFQIGQEKAARDLMQLYNKLTVDPKNWTVAWGRHDNQLDAKTAQLLLKQPNQLVWNGKEWEDPILKTHAPDQKKAWRRWELTRPVNQINTKPKQGSVVQMTGSIRPPEQAVYKDGRGGLAWRDPRTNAVIDQKQAQARWQATRPAGHKNDVPNEKSVVDLAVGQWQNFTDEYGRTGYQRVDKKGNVFETRYDATGTNQPPRLSASIQNGALGGERTSQAHVPKPTKPKIVIDEVDSHTNIGSRQRAPGAFIPKAGKGEIAKVVQNPNSGVTTTYLKNGAIYSQKLGANAYRSKPPDIVALNRVDIQTPSYLQQFGTPDQQDRNAGQEVTDNQPKYSYPPVDYATDERHPAEVLGAKPQSPPAKAVAPTTGTSNQLDPAIQAAMNRQQTANNPYGIRDFNEDGLDDITGQPVAEIVNDAWKISQPEAPKPPTATNPAALYSGNPNDDPMGEPAQPTSQPVVAANPTIIASGNPTGIYEAPKAGAPLTGIVPSFDPGENIPRGKMGMY